jgi:glycosyltransferase involved in cell wall biosynthesis
VPRKKDIEFILINDGSTDGSEQILERYAEQDPRFRVIHQENRGFAGEQ